MFKDQAKRQTISPIANKKYKGKVTVQLFDAKTGELEKETHGENMVTNVIKKIFESNYFGGMFYQQLMPLSKHMFGGVLCFQNAQTEDADNMYFPNNNPVIAHAGQSNETYDTANDSTRGTVNSLESSVITGGYRHVWDFASTQGNGTISSLSLTHKDFGDYALNDKYTIDGNTSWLFEPFEELKYVPGGDDRALNVWSIGMISANDQRPPILFDLIDNIAYRLTGNSTTLTILERKSYGVINGIGLNETAPCDVVASNLYNVSHTLTMPYDAQKMRYLLRKISAPEYDATVTYAEGAKAYHDGRLYKANTAISTAEAWNENHWDLQVCYDMHAIYPDGSTIYRRIINLTDFTMTTSNLTVPGASMLPPTNGNPNGDCYPICLDANDYAYILGDNKKVYKVKYTNPSDVSSFTYQVRSDTSEGDMVDRLRNNLHGIGNIGVSAACGLIFVGSNVYECKVGDRFAWVWNGFHHNVISYIDNHAVLYSPLGYSTLAGGVGIANIVNKMYLATIFNLQEPIVKAATQTMKITYEITEQEEEEDEQA